MCQVNPAVEVETGMKINFGEKATGQSGEMTQKQQNLENLIATNIRAGARRARESFEKKRGMRIARALRRYGKRT
jgi:hypothetical protein